MSANKNSEEVSKQISQILITRSYISLKELRELFPENDYAIMDILENLQESFDKIGAQLDIIELDQLDYVVISSKAVEYNKILTEKEYTILGLFAQLVKLQGNGIVKKQISQLFGQYLEELDLLQQYHLITHIYSEQEDTYYLTPLGAIIIGPVMSKIQNLLEKT